ncbi:glycosyltransferase family 2 protein [Cochleicola gelatinilyticus]|uniref:Glycosyltransferase 2-like domain-containing protein n=1 Tax=Cochleicola gelatinilyticus TaxID=1763537 RepID=A0A167IQT7_9FLAO|nr:glycosyltransferase [Cochleicola gelatinilyticus]OAB79919.1 hypothetical protein ULVI_04045 [Cochleicola gelatinilyticus]
MIYIFGILLLGYAFSLGMLLYGFRSLSETALEDKKVPTTETASEEVTRFSIIIPFRNEAQHLPKLVASLLQLSYPSEAFEVLFVDDASEDASEAILGNTLKAHPEFRHTILKNKRTSASPKKDAISEALHHAKNQWIVTTDADCEVLPTWLTALHNCIVLQNPVLIAAPILYTSTTKVVQQFQQLDGLSLQMVTMGGFGLQHPLLCNGANLAYQKDAFETVNGFSGNDHIASGDDIFLLDKIRDHFPKQVTYLKSKDAVVSTHPQPTWKKVLAQRVRWASKTSQQENWISKLLGMWVLMTNLGLLLGWVSAFISPSTFYFYFLFVILKWGIDSYMLYTSAHFFELKINAKALIASLLVYPLLTVTILLQSVSGSYEWKGRAFKAKGTH